MNSNNEHPRSKWPIRRIQDWLNLISIASVLCTFSIFGVKLVRIHTHVVDEIHTIESDHSVILPRLAKVEEREDVVDAKLDMILSDVREIKRRLP